MISEHTPPGTQVICIDAQDCEPYLTQGALYTVLRMVESSKTGYVPATGIGVELVEVAAPIPPGLALPVAWNRRRFRRAHLPKCLTDMLMTEPVG